MIDIFSRILRAAIFAVLALLGMAMALIFMFSTAIAVGVLYVVARLRGKPFGIRSYWSERTQAYGFASRPFGASPFGRTDETTGAEGGPARGRSRPAVRRPADVIDVEVREVN